MTSYIIPPVHGHNYRWYTGQCVRVCVCVCVVAGCTVSALVNHVAGVILKTIVIALPGVIRLCSGGLTLFFSA